MCDSSWICRSVRTDASWYTLKQREESSSTDGDHDQDHPAFEDDDEDYLESGPINNSRNIRLTSPLVLEVLDRCGISNRNAIMLFQAAIMDEHTKSHDVTDYVLDYNSIRRARIRYRSKFAAEVKREFNPEVSLTTH